MYLFLFILFYSCKTEKKNDSNSIDIEISQLDSINLDLQKNIGKVSQEVKCELYNDIALKDYFFDLSESHEISLDSLKRIRIKEKEDNYMVPINRKFSNGKLKYRFIKFLKKSSCYILEEKLDANEVDISEMMIINMFSLKRYYLSNSYSDEVKDYPIESKNGEYILFYENYNDKGLKSNVYIFKKNNSNINIHAKIKLDFNIKNALWIENDKILIETFDSDEIINYYLLSF